MAQHLKVVNMTGGVGGERERKKIQLGTQSRKFSIAYSLPDSLKSSLQGPGMGSLSLMCVWLSGSRKTTLQIG